MTKWAHLDGVFSIGNEISAELDVDGVVAGELGCEGDGESAVTSIDDVDVDVAAAGRADTAGHLASAGL